MEEAVLGNFRVQPMRHNQIQLFRVLVRPKGATTITQVVAGLYFAQLGMRLEVVTQHILIR
jgi:hypothetical protein